MLRYYKQPLPTIQMASNLAWRLARPTQVPETADDVTKNCFGWITHPELDEYAAEIPDNFLLPIHQFIKDSVASGNGVSVYFDQFYPTPEEAAEKKAIVVNSTEPLPVIDIIPDDWVEIPYSQLEAEGWFVDQ